MWVPRYYHSSGVCEPMGGDSSEHVTQPAPLMIVPNHSLVNFETIHISLLPKFSGETTWDDTTWRQTWSPQYLCGSEHPEIAEWGSIVSDTAQQSWQFERSHFSPRKKPKSPAFLCFFLKVPNVPTRISKPKFQASLGNGAISFSIPGLEGFTHTIRQQGHGSEKKLPMTTSPRGISPSESGHN